jgi:glycosyltransferase involved in cell wall biosynthesis
MRRVAVVTNEIPEYRYPIFKRLFDLRTLDLYFLLSLPIDRSCYSAQQHLPLKYSRSINVWFETRHRESGGTQREQMPIPVALLKDLLSLRPNVIIAGDFGARTIVCWLAAKLLHADFIIWSEEISSSALGRSRLQRGIRRFLPRRARACLAWGMPARDYLLSLGVKSNRVFLCAQAVDNDMWIQLAEETDRRQIRRELGFKGTVFLLVGRMIERKGFRNFIDAWLEASKRLQSPITAVIAGSGEQEDELKRRTRERGLTNVLFVGKLTPLELARYYASADIFVFPSLEDVWGLVVNEALCFGLPVMGSKFAGSTQALIANSDLGIVFDPSNHSEFAALLIELAASPPPINRERSRERLNGMTFDHSFRAIVEMLDYLSAQRELT